MMKRLIAACTLLLSLGACSEEPLGPAALGPGLTPEMSLLMEPVSQVSAGGTHTCTVASDGSVACWGTTAPLGTFTQVSAGYSKVRAQSTAAVITASCSLPSMVRWLAEEESTASASGSGTGRPTPSSTIPRPAQVPTPTPPRCWAAAASRSTTTSDRGGSSGASRAVNLGPVPREWGPALGCGVDTQESVEPAEVEPPDNGVRSRRDKPSRRYHTAMAYDACHPLQLPAL